VAISGAMDGSMRFVFQQGGPLAVRRQQSDGKSYRVPAGGTGSRIGQVKYRRTRRRRP
jgi:hypothetical protein